MVIRKDNLAFFMKTGAVTEENLKNFDISENEDRSLEIRPRTAALKLKDVLESLPEAPADATISVKAGLRGIEEGIIDQKKLTKLSSSSFKGRNGGAQLVQYRDPKSYEDPLVKAQREANEAKTASAAASNGNADFPESATV